MLIVWFFVYKKLAQFAVRGALPPRRSESPGCAANNKPSCVLHLLGWFIGFFLLGTKARILGLTPLGLNYSGTVIHYLCHLLYNQLPRWF